MRSVLVSGLIPYPNNARTHTAAQVGEIAASIKHFGWTVPILIDENGGVLAGHGRLEAAKSLGMERVPAIVAAGMTEEQKRAYILADNKLAENAGWDDALLRAELSDLRALGADLQVIGFDERELRKIFGADDLEAPEPQLDKAAALQKKWKTRRGQIWQIGEHRLMCGDSTDADTVNRIRADVSFTLLVADPPYGVNYDPAWRNEAAEKGLISYAARSVGKVQNDDRIDWSAAYELANCQAAYVWHADRHASEVQRSLEASGYSIVCQIIWAKPIFAISRGDYHWQHEPCWYAVKKGKNHNWQGSRSETTLWPISRGCSEKTGHGTEKPVECMARPIRNNSVAGQIVFDPFIGSGTTMCAAQALERICYGIDVSPAYVAVALERMSEMGLKPELIKKAKAVAA